MPTRRQEKAARVVKEAVSDAIANHLNDPRIEGFVSVTRVEVAADLRTADVYISVFGGDEAAQSKTFAAITHARSRIQSLLAEGMQSKFCPVLRFQLDDKFKKAMEIINLIEKTASEREKKEAADREQKQM
jgi:ribosome-binding factor A